MKLRNEWEYTCMSQEVPYIPGRRRWTASYRGEEIAKPLRRQMKKLIRIRHNEIYWNTTRDGALDETAEEASWDIIASCRRTNEANIGSN